MKKILLSLFIGLVSAGLMGAGDTLAQQGTPPDIRVSLALTNSRPVPGQLVYLLDDPATSGVTDPDPIRMVITLKNYGADSAITSKGFGERPFHLFLIFTGPDKQPITANAPSDTALEDPPPPRVKWVPALGSLVQVEPVEVLSGSGTQAGPWALSIQVPDAHAFYTLAKAGPYSVKALIPMRTYKAIDHPGPPPYSEIDQFKWSGALHSNTVDFILVADKDGDGFSYPVAVSPPYGTLPDCDDNNPSVNPGAAEILGNGIDDDCNPQTPDGAQDRGTIAIKAERHVVGTGDHPGSVKYPIVGLPVRAFDRTDPCVAQIGASQYGYSWQNYPAFWACPSETVYCNSLGPLTDRCTTDLNGLVSLTLPPGSYVVIGLYDPSASQTGDETYLGSKVDNLRAGQTEMKYLQVIEKADAKKVPAKYTIKTGSEIMIIEPEYVEWNGTRELYPFIFQSIGDWTVTTTVAPPEGFVADKNSLTERVNSALEAVQFTITDVGSKWVETEVQHKMTHKKKTEVLKSKVGVKLTEKLAKEKGVDIYGKPLK